MKSPTPRRDEDGPTPAEQDRLLAEVRDAYRQLDPAPPELVPRVQAALAMAVSDVDAELMELVEESSQLAGVRGGSAYTLRFQHDQSELVLRVSAEEDAARIDGWVVPAEPASVTVLLGEQRQATDPVIASELGRFEVEELPRGLVRLRLEPHDPTRPAFVTPGFEI